MMKLEVGKTYKLSNGKVHKCTHMVGDDPLSVDVFGYGPFRIDGCCYHIDGTFADGPRDELNVVSCVDDEPTLWRDMTPEEKGALLLAKHEEKAIECFNQLIGKWVKVRPDWCDNMAYRIKPEPKVETVVIFAKDSLWGWVVDNSLSAERTHSITFSTIDGKPDTASIKMEVL